MPSKRPNWPARPASDPLILSAVSQAIDLALTPRLVEPMRRAPLPRDVSTVIRLATGCEEATSAVSLATTREPGFLRNAADLYLRQVVCFGGAGPHRMLGVSRSASLDQARQNMRHLVVWLHPDSSPSGGDPALMQRVVEAWHAIQSGKPETSAPRRPANTGPGRRQPGPAYRPMWVSQPLPKAPPRLVASTRLRIATRTAIVLACLVVPDFSVSFALPGSIWAVPDDETPQTGDASVAPATGTPGEAR